MIKAINRNAIKSVLGGVRVQTWTIRIYVIREVVNFNLHYKQTNKQKTNYISKLKWAWQAHFLTHILVILKNCVFLEDKQMILV